jgi:hypothetical protein
LVPLVAIVFVITAGAALVYWAYRAVERRSARPVPPEERPAPVTAMEPTVPPPPEGLCYVFCHEYARPVPVGKPTLRRTRCIAPITGEEVEARDVAARIFFVALAELYMDGSVDLDIRPTDPGLMPPFPHKSWEMHVRKRRDFPRTPVADRMANVFLERSSSSRGRKGSRGEAILVDELIEKTVAAMRRDTSFWRRAGVYADVRNFVEAHLLERGYLVGGGGQTLLDRIRGSAPTVNDLALDMLRSASDDLEARLDQFEQRHGLRGDVTLDDNPWGVHMPLVDASVEADQVPLSEGLRISVIEALVVIRQMEPSDDVGI